MAASRTSSDGFTSDAAPPAPPGIPQDVDAGLPSTAFASSDLGALGVPTRNRILVLGRRGSGKTVLLTRLYEALWQGCQLVNGRYVPERPAQKGDFVRRLAAKARDGRVHTELRKLAMDMDDGRWPLSTQSTTHIELDITLDGRTHVLTALDYPGEVFRTAFAQGGTDPASEDLRQSVDAARALILLVDPSIALKRGIEREEDKFGLVAAVERVRSAPGGEDVPIVIVLTKCDLHVPLLSAKGGPRALCTELYPQLFRQLDRTVVFASSATSVARSPRGHMIPRRRRAPRDVIEPLCFCLDWIERAQELASLEQAQIEASLFRADQLRSEQLEEEQELRAARNGMLILWFGIAAVLIATALVTLRAVGKL